MINQLKLIIGQASLPVMPLVDKRDKKLTKPTTFLVHL